MNDYIFRRGALSIFVLLLFPAVVSANMGLPVGTYSVQWTVFLFIPIVLIEGWVLRDDLKVSYGRALGTTVPANILSTLAGIVVPLITIPLVIAEGLISTVATLVLFVPLFFLSRAIESAYSRWSLGRNDEALHKAVHRANLMSYALLTIFVVTRFLKSWYVHGRVIW